MEIDSKELSWAWLTADQLLTTQPCELLYVFVAPSGATTNSAIYNGKDANGDKITSLPAAAVTGLEFRPARPVYCARGLFIDVGTNVTGIFVQWRGR